MLDDLTTTLVLALAGSRASQIAVGSAAALVSAALVWSWRRSQGGRTTERLSIDTARVRRTLAAVERLTDPHAVERRVTEAMRELDPNARFELLRSPTAPRGLLTHAREADPDLLALAVARGALSNRGLDDAPPSVRLAWDRLAIDHALPVAHAGTVFGLLAVEGKRVRGRTVLELQRFADLLAFKLEMHRLYAELAQRERLSAMGSLAAAIAHDIRTPLATIHLGLQLLVRDRGKLEAQHADVVDIAMRQARRLQELTDELVDYARPLTIERHAVPASELLGGAVESVRAAARAAHVRVDVHVDPRITTIEGDAQALTRALVNLLQNAIEFSPSGADVRLEARLREALELRVIDRGPGIPTADRERIFEAFYTTRRGGTGLGLATVRRVVEAHRGSIAVDGGPGIGTTMTVQLPLG